MIEVIEDARILDNLEREVFDGLVSLAELLHLLFPFGIEHVLLAVARCASAERGRHIIWSRIVFAGFVSASSTDINVTSHSDASLLRGLGGGGRHQGAGCRCA